MSDTVIKAEGLGKKYIISHEGAEKYTALRDVIEEKTQTIFGKRKPSAKEEFWALKDLSFEIKKGEAVGIIGRNGAGKSTLLKILSRITEPTTGRVEIHGRVSSLLEVGTGFHPELTGRENIFLNGAILGMSRQEIKRKFDAIVVFSGVERFLDTPVKRFSSGMYLRLAFAVAAHLDPEILIVDEVLAVGDSEFQRKCLGKMDEVSRSEGRTVLFVSHNMAAIRQLCNQVYCLDEGRIIFEGAVPDGIDFYDNKTRSQYSTGNEILQKREAGSKKAVISAIEVKLTEDKKIRISVFVSAVEPVANTEIAVGINDGSGARLITFHCRFVAQRFHLAQGMNEFICTANNFFLKPGTYSMNVFVGNKYETLDYLDNPVHFEIKQYSFYPHDALPDQTQGALMADHTWVLKTRGNEE